MPSVNVKVIEGVFTRKQKQEIVERLSETMVSIEGDKPAPGHLGRGRGGQERRVEVAGQPLTTEAVRKLAAGG
jgi:4-oxalocrotonate tautomerase